jgi:hypothetical protein
MLQQEGLIGFKPIRPFLRIVPGKIVNRNIKMLRLLTHSQNMHEQLNTFTRVLPAPGKYIFGS